MYNNVVGSLPASALPVVSSPAAVAALPFTGINVVWILLAAFTLMAAGGALYRMARRA